MCMLYIHCYAFCAQSPGACHICGITTYIGQTYVLTDAQAIINAISSCSDFSIGEVRAPFETELVLPPITVGLPNMASLTSVVTSVSRCQSQNDWSNRMSGQSVLTLI